VDCEDIVTVYRGLDSPIVLDFQGDRFGMITLGILEAMPIVASGCECRDSKARCSYDYVEHLEHLEHLGEFARVAV
jgi:hypothetical protein